MKVNLRLRPFSPETINWYVWFTLVALNKQYTRHMWQFVSRGRL